MGGGAKIAAFTDALAAEIHVPSVAFDGPTSTHTQTYKLTHTREERANI